MNKRRIYNLPGGLIKAIRTLTIIPCPGAESGNPAEALPFFPVIGLGIGVLAATGAWLVGGVFEWAWGAGVLIPFIGFLVTRGLHLDGLADTVDGLIGGRTREEKLSIMKDSRVGAFGVMAVVFVLLFKAAAVARLAEHREWALICLPFVLSRMAQVRLAVSLPYARPEGGMAGDFVRQAEQSHWFVAMGLSLIFCLVLGFPQGLVAFVLALIAAFGLVLWCKRIFGGVTGDLLGFSSELIETLLLALLALPER